MHCTIEGMDILFSDYRRITQHNHMLNATAIKNHLPYQKLSNPSTIKGPSPFLMRLQFHACWIACRWQISNDSTTWWVTMASTRGRGFWFRSATQKSLWAAPATSRWTIMPRERLQSFTLRDAQVAKLNPWQALLLQRGEAKGFSSRWGGACTSTMGLLRTTYLLLKVIRELPWWSTPRTWGGSSNVQGGRFRSMAYVMTLVLDDGYCLMCYIV